MKGLNSLFPHIGLFQSISVFLFILARKLQRFFRGYAIELYHVQTFIQRKGGLLKKGNEGHAIVSIQEDVRPLSFVIRRHSSDAAAFLQVFEIQEYQPLVSLIKSYKDISIKRIVDVGANVGYTSIYLLSKFPDAQVIAIEADPGNLGAFKINLDMNKLHNYVMLHKALWKSSERVELSNSFRDHREWSRQVQSISSSKESLKNSIPGISLKDLFSEYSLDEVDILKIDIEGAEKEVFSDINASIEIMKRVKFLVIELHDEVDFKSEFESILRSADFGFTYFGESLIGFNKSLVK